MESSSLTLSDLQAYITKLSKSRFLVAVLTLMSPITLDRSKTSFLSVRYGSQEGAKQLNNNL